ncbi:hypothetical protein Hanom_Chr10g00890171 [Helianthus anomalus]
MLGVTYMRFSSCIYVYRLFVMLYLSCFTMYSFTTHAILVASYAHTHLMCYLYICWMFWSRVSHWKHPLYPYG